MNKESINKLTPSCTSCWVYYSKLGNVVLQDLRKCPKTGWDTRHQGLGQLPLKTEKPGSFQNSFYPSQPVLRDVEPDLNWADYAIHQRRNILEQSFLAYWTAGGKVEAQGFCSPDNKCEEKSV